MACSSDEVLTATLSDFPECVRCERGDIASSADGGFWRSRKKKMLKKIAQYTCVFTWLIWSCPCFGDSAAVRNDAPAADTASASKPAATSAAAGEIADRSKSILAKARDTNEAIYSSLRSFVCNEQIQRFKGSLGAETGKQIDTVTATVSFENGTEHYADIRQNTKMRPSMSSLAGAWSEGEFGTLLQQTQMLLSTQTPTFDMYADLNGVPTAVYEVEIGGNESPWDLEVKSHHYRVPFRSKVWVSEAGGEILKIERISTSIPFQMGISEIRWNVVLKEVDLNGRMWLLPSAGEYAVSYENSGHREWNSMQFSDYRRYGSEVAIRFQ